MEGKKFKLLGRANEIIKVSGKRISIVELESIIENGFGIADVLISIKSDNTKLKDESLEIKIAGRKMPSESDVKALFKSHYPETNFSFELSNVKSIEKNNMGKKVRR